MKIYYFILFSLFALMVAEASQAVAQPIPAPAKEIPPCKFGAYYFDGWTGQTNRWHITDRLQTEFADREPIWGWITSTPDIMRQQIDYAADAGLSYFAFCWYDPEGPDDDAPMNHALRLFREAPNRNRMEFCLLVANHAGYRIGPKDWDSCIRKWIPLLTDQQALKTAGEPLILFFSPEELERSFGGKPAVKAAFARLRANAIEAGLPGVAIGGCFLPNSDLKSAVEMGYTLVTGYNYNDAGVMDHRKREQKFDDLTTGSVRIWDRIARHSSLPCIPAVTLGWDMRPWEPKDLDESRQSFRYTDRSPPKVADAVRTARRWVNANPTQATSERLIILYAWNENGEGAYLTPGKRDGTRYLDAVSTAIRAVIP